MAIELRHIDDVARRIRKAILADVTGRRGWRQEWDQMDDYIQREIKADWLRLIKAELEKAP